MIIRRGEVWLAALDPTIGGEIQKTRPVIIVSNNVNNTYNSVVSVIPLTSNITRVLSFEVLIPAGAGGVVKESKVKTDQIRTIDKSRLTRRFGLLPDDLIYRVDNALKLHLAL